MSNSDVLSFPVVLIKPSAAQRIEKGIFSKSVRYANLSTIAGDNSNKVTPSVLIVASL